MKLFKTQDPEYRPWESKEWQCVFDAAELRLSKERVYTLIQFLKQSLISSDGDVIEMGVYKGCTSYCIGYFMNELAQNGGGRTLYLCDTFAGTPDSYDKSRGDINRLGKYADTSVQYVEDKMKKSYDRVRLIEGFIPDSLTQIPEDVRFSFAHIHLNLHKSTKDALIWLKDKVVFGGTVIIEDYGIQNCRGVRNAADELADEGIIDIIYLPTGQAVIHYR